MLLRVVRVAGVLAAAGLVLMGGLRVVYGVVTQAPPRFTLLDGCASPCWLGIQPGLTPMEQAEQLAADAGAQAQRFGPRNPYLSVILPDDLTLIGRVNTDINGIALRIVLEVEDRCPADVVYTYGIPSHITFDGRAYRLYYPTHNVRLFWQPTQGSNGSPDAFTVDVAANRRVLFADYVAFFRVPWDSFATQQLQSACQ